MPEPSITTEQLHTYNIKIEKKHSLYIFQYMFYYYLFFYTASHINSCAIILTDFHLVITLYIFNVVIMMTIILDLLLCISQYTLFLLLNLSNVCVCYCTSHHWFTVETAFASLKTTQFNKCTQRTRTFQVVLSNGLR